MYSLMELQVGKLYCSIWNELVFYQVIKVNKTERKVLVMPYPYNKLCALRREMVIRESDTKAVFYEVGPLMLVLYA